MWKSREREVCVLWPQGETWYLWKTNHSAAYQSYLNNGLIKKDFPFLYSHPLASKLGSGAAVAEPKLHWCGKWVTYLEQIQQQMYQHPYKFNKQNGFTPAGGNPNIWVVENKCKTHCCILLSLGEVPVHVSKGSSQTSRIWAGQGKGQLLPCFQQLQGWLSFLTQKGHIFTEL